MIKIEKNVKFIRKEPYSAIVRIEITGIKELIDRGTPLVVTEGTWKITCHRDVMTNVFPHSNEIYIGGEGSTYYEFDFDRSHDFMEILDGLEAVINKFNYLNEV